MCFIGIRERFRVLRMWTQPTVTKLGDNGLTSGARILLCRRTCHLVTIILIFISIISFTIIVIINFTIMIMSNSILIVIIICRRYCLLDNHQAFGKEIYMIILNQKMFWSPYDNPLWTMVTFLFGKFSHFFFKTI